MDIREPIEWKIPPLSIPSAKVRAPPPPANASVTAPIHASPCGLAAMKSPPPKPGLQFACASPRWRADASSIFENACETTSCVESVPITEAMLTAAGSLALLSVPGSEMISMTFRSAPIAHGRS